MSPPSPAQQSGTVSPERVLATLTAYQRTALEGALDLDLFAALGAGPETAAGLAARCAASARGARILCDYLTVEGFLTKDGVYDLVLLANFLHPFDLPTCERLLRKVRASLAEGGRAAIVEFVADDDRLSPGLAAQFGLVMLCSTPAGDAYTFAALGGMLHNAGFGHSELHPLPPSPPRAIIARR